MSDPTGQPVVLSGGDVTVWVVDDSAIHLKCVTPHADPVELNAEEARQLAAVLLRLAAELD